MNFLLKLSALIDRVNVLIGQAAAWLMLLAVLISAGNAFIRYGFSRSSNAWLEIQWYLFAAMVMLGAAYTLKMNEHVRVDAFYGRYSERTRLWVDLLGTLFFLLPMTVIIGWLGWPALAGAFASGETSGNAGGLVKWPALLMIPLGFLLLTLQGVSEVIKRAAALTGRTKIDAAYEKPLQ